MKKTYNEAEHEQDSRRMMEHISQHKASCEAAAQGRSKEQTAEREKTRRKEMCHYIAASAATVATGVAVMCCMNAGLIAPVLAIPATYIFACHLGWCLCKVSHYIKKGVGKR